MRIPLHPLPLSIGFCLLAALLVALKLSTHSDTRDGDSHPSPSSRLSSPSENLPDPAISSASGELPSIAPSRNDDPSRSTDFHSSDHSSKTKPHARPFPNPKIHGNRKSIPLADARDRLWVGGPYGLPQPAALVDLQTDDSPQDSDFDRDIQTLAENFSSAMAESGLDPSSPGYHKLWAENVASSDLHFRQKYGSRIWMTHHIQSYHLAAGNLPSP